MKAYWSRCARGRNFGDLITPWLFAKLGIEIEWSEPSSSEMIGCGSILGTVPNGYTGIVLGAGFLRSRERKNLREARVLALRGAQTKARCGLLRRQSPVLGDLGLVMSAFVPSERTCEFRIGEIPHYMVYNDVKAQYERHPQDALLISVLDPVDHVIRQAARCERIVTSSLHGMVLADCLGVPSMWVMDERVIGGGFKFHDYASAFGEAIRPGQWRQVPHARVVERGRELLDLAREAAREVRGHGRG